ncbi:MAG: hypothetical protein KAJ91_03455, partial [Candidatus Aenigmarchaeota archaeon]|nr:hypothetical protein [Candidatus Aenigmarchaeota archaeon]
FDVLTSDVQIYLENGFVSPSSGSWGGGNFTFNVSVNTTGINNVTVFLWTGPSAAGPWTSRGQQNYTIPPGDWQNITVSQNFGCADYGTNYYFFNATNYNGTIKTTSFQTFTVDKEKVNYIYNASTTGDGVTANRMGSQASLMNFIVQDANGTYLNGFPIKFSVTYNNNTQTGWYSDDNYVVLTNSSAYANLNYDPTCSNEYAGAPKFAVGEQQWKIEVNDSALSCYQQNDSYISNMQKNTFVRGDITLDFQKPDENLNSTNPTQKDLINFLGATTDDCADPLTATARYFANHSTTYFECDTVTQVGANAFNCDWQTNISTPEGYYNTTMMANASYYYTNSTSNYVAGDLGLFYLFPVYTLYEPSILPTSHGWGYRNWNFSVSASSGDDDPHNVTVLLASGSPTGFTECSDCVNQTVITCVAPGCLNTTMNWFKNFTYQDVGAWFFKFGLNTEETSGFDTFTLIKDNVSVEYRAGNESNPTTSVPANFSVGVYDFIAGTYNLSPSAEVHFELLHANYPDGIKEFGIAYTDSDGNATYEFLPTCSYVSGAQLWRAYVSDTYPGSGAYYKNYSTENFTTTLTLSGCSATPEIEAYNSPNETFQYNNITIKVDIKSYVADSTDVYAELIAPAAWDVDGRIRHIGTITEIDTKTVYWLVNTTTYGVSNITIKVNNSEGTEDIESIDVTVYEYFSASAVNTPMTIPAGENGTVAFNCIDGMYRSAKYQLDMDSALGTNIRVYTYNHTSFIDVRNYISVTGIANESIELLRSQMTPNGTGVCLLRIENTGQNPIDIDAALLDATYLTRRADIVDVVPLISDYVTYSMDENDDSLEINVSVFNSYTASLDATLWMNITDENDAVVNYSTRNVLFSAQAISIESFDNINTSTWSNGIYTIKASMNYSGNSSYMEKEIIVDTLQYEARTIQYVCPTTTENVSVVFTHNYRDDVSYNITLDAPVGWQVLPSEVLINASTTGRKTTAFNITSPVAGDNATINVSIAYVLPHKSAETSSSFVMNNTNQSVIEVIRETPQYVSASKVFESQLVVHNKGCLASSGLTLQETIKEGWTPANPGMLGDVSLISSSVNLEDNYVTWQLGDMAVNQYAVLTYQIKASVSNSEVGYMWWNLTFDGTKEMQDFENFTVHTANYSSESHLEFDIETIQRSAYPWTEPRSVQPNMTYNYTLKVTNIGDATADNWSVFLYASAACNITDVFNSGTLNSTQNSANWSVSALASRATTQFNFTANC